MSVQQEHVAARRLAAPRDDGANDHASSEQRVSVLVGDRLCHTCGYNLTGQTVFREPHYRMLIVRCPECATVASVQEYPLLGRWANRWAAILAGLAMIVIVAIWIGSGAMIFGISLGVAEVTADRYRNVIDQLHAQAQQAGQQAPAAPTPAQPTVIQVPGQPPIVIQTPPVGRMSGFGNWWAAQDQAAIFQQAGGWRHAVEWRALWLWIPLAIATCVVGCVWSVILLARRGGSLIACGACILLVAFFFSFFPIYEWYTDTPWSPWAASRATISPVFLLASITFASLPLACGLIAGRRVARGLVRLMLPPRLRSSLALLWTADGLNPPRPTF